MMMIQMILQLYDMSTFEVKYQLTVYFLHKKATKRSICQLYGDCACQIWMFQIDDEYDVDE